jgi:hypothetical protein
MVTIQQLRKAASDLNKVLELEPKIDNGQQKHIVEQKIAKASELLEDGDVLQQGTVDVLLELECDVPAGVKISKDVKSN